MAFVNTWRAVTVLRVGDSEGFVNDRYPGDLVPEAADWPNRNVYIHLGQLAAALVDETELAAWEAKHAEDRAASGFVSQAQEAVAEAPKKRVVKKKVTASGDNAERLTEQSV